MTPCSVSPAVGTGSRRFKGTSIKRATRSTCGVLLQMEIRGLCCARGMPACLKSCTESWTSADHKDYLSALCKLRKATMVSPWWAASVVVPGAVALKAALGGKRRKDDSPRVDHTGDQIFVCERVCTSDRLMRRMGGLAKDVTPDTCVTVCGVTAVDACRDACNRVVCSNTHQVPAWNEACESRCSAECQKGRAS